jgi:hypothetical protein
MVEIAIIYYNTPAIYQTFIITLKERNTKLKQVSRGWNPVYFGLFIPMQITK